jgi:hypothetical protein
MYLKKLFTIFFILIFSLIFLSCSKDKDKVTEKTQQKVQEDEDFNPADTNLTVEEKFSTSILGDFLSNSEDDDLAAYLEDQLFKYNEKFRGASLTQLTESLWLVSLENQGTIKNFLLQKFVDFKTNDYYFNLKETTLTINDVALAAAMYRNSASVKETELQKQNNQNLQAPQK